MAGSLTPETLDEALKLLGERFKEPIDVEILLVGGAAGMVSGLLPAHRTTGDCDVMIYQPHHVMAAVELAADQVGKELALPAHWFNSKAQIRLDSLPDGWRDRRVWYCTHGRLSIFTASRVDLIAMKFLAHRPQDLEDLKDLHVRPDDAAFVRAYLDGLPAKQTTASEISEARDYLEAWEIEP